MKRSAVPEPQVLRPAFEGNSVTAALRWTLRQHKFFVARAPESLWREVEGMVPQDAAYWTPIINGPEAFRNSGEHGREMVIVHGPYQSKKLPSNRKMRYDANGEWFEDAFATLVRASLDRCANDSRVGEGAQQYKYAQTQFIRTVPPSHHQLAHQDFSHRSILGGAEGLTLLMAVHGLLILYAHVEGRWYRLALPPPWFVGFRGDAIHVGGESNVHCVRMHMYAVLEGHQIPRDSFYEVIL
jgi:hypothetical protein